MIQLRKTLTTARDLLSRENIDYALIGGFALGAHGIHRATKDIDLLVDGVYATKVKVLFTDCGFNIFNETKELIQMDGPGYLDIVFANRPQSLEMLKNARNGVHLAGVPVVSRESLIGLKIQAYKNEPRRELQDKADIQALLRQDGIDLKQVKLFADLFDAWKEIEDLLK
jgi:hypothetical protein